MGHLFYVEFGSTAGSSLLTTADPAELAKFTNVQPLNYWSGTEFTLNPVFAWQLDAVSGLQGTSAKVDSLHTWAVRSGDVGGAVPVPLTRSLGLMAVVVGLLAGGFAAFRRRDCR